MSEAKRSRLSGYAEHGIYAYAPDGNTRRVVFLKIGDTVTWKRQGTRGSYEGTVVLIGHCIRIRIHSHDGLPITPREINTNRILKAFRDGKDLAA